MDVMRLQNRLKPTAAVRFDHFVDTDVFQAETIAGTPTDNSGGGANQGDVTITLSNTTSGASSVRPGDIVMFPKSKLTGYVESKTNGTGDSITIKATESDVTTLELLGVAALADAAGDTVVCVGNAAGEGAGERQTLRHTPILRYGQIQAMVDTLEMTDIQMAIKTEPGVNGDYSPMAMAELNFLTRWNGDISNTLITSRMSTGNFEVAAPDVVDASSNPIQTMKGLDQWIQESGVLDSAVTVSTDAYKKLSRELIRARAPKNFMVFGGFDFLADNDSMLHNLNDARIEPFSQYGQINLDGKVIDIATTALNLFGFKYEFYHLPVLNHEGIHDVTGVDGYNKHVYFLPMGDIGLRGGGSAPRFCVRYLEVPGTTQGMGAFTRSFTDGTNDVATNKRIYRAYYGFECLGADHAARWVLA